MTSKTDNTEEGTPEGLEDTQAFREALAKGGIWTDENLEKSLDWAGETTSEKAAEGSMHVAQPLTKKEQTDVELSEAGITAETIATITDQVFQRISKSREIKDQELALRTDRQIQSKTSNIDKWIERVEARVSTLAEQQSATDKAQLSRLEEKLAALENKIDATLGAMTTLGSHEARLIHEAHRIIMDRKATEESDDASEPSIYGRMNERSANLHKALREMEPHADKAARVLTQSLQRTTNTRKKFGRL